MKKVVLLTLVFIFINSFFGACCYYDSCGCNTVEGSRYEVSELSLALRQFRASDGKTPFNNTILPEDPKTPHNEFAFVFTPEITTLALARNYASAGMLFACDPAFSPTQEFSNIKITSNAVYETNSTTFAVGDNLESIFKISGDFSGDEFLVSEFLNQLDRSVTDRAFYMILTAPPGATFTHQFTFEFELSDGSIFTLVSDSIELN